MERNIEQEVIMALAENNIYLTVRTSKKGFAIECVTDPKNYDKMEIYQFSGPTLKTALQRMLKDPKFAGEIDSELFLAVTAKDLDDENPADIIDTLSITNPYFRELLNAFDRSLQEAAYAVEDKDIATVTAKIVLEKDEFAPDFENDAKLFSAAKFSVGVGIKREVTKYTGQTQEFLTRTVDGRMLLVNPDRQITLDEAIEKAEEESGNKPKQKNLMADAPVDPDEEADQDEA